MAIPLVAASAAFPSALAVGAAAHLALATKPLQAKVWLPTGGFVGVINGAAAPPQAPTNAPVKEQGKTVKPIGGKTDKPAPPTPFGKFPRHRPSKLPGPPRPYDPNGP